jgi:hypothetical protein
VNHGELAVVRETIQKWRLKWQQQRRGCRSSAW